MYQGLLVYQSDAAGRKSDAAGVHLLPQRWRINLVVAIDTPSLRMDSNAAYT